MNIPAFVAIPIRIVFVLGAIVIAPMVLGWIILRALYGAVMEG